MAEAILCKHCKSDLSVTRTHQSPHQAPLQRDYGSLGNRGDSPRREFYDPPKPSGMIAIAWVCFFLGILPLGILSLLLDITSVVLGVILMSSEHREAKKHGRTIVVIQVVWYALVFLGIL